MGLLLVEWSVILSTLWYTRVLPFCYCEVFGPGKGNVRWKECGVKVGSTVLFFTPNVDGMLMGLRSSTASGKWLLRADRILLPLVIVM